MLTRLRLENFSSWKNSGDIALKPITGILGREQFRKYGLSQTYFY